VGGSVPAAGGAARREVVRALWISRSGMCVE
jgi:hypothetical protein